MTSMEMAITGLMERPMAREGAHRSTIWQLPVLAAVVLHGAAFALILAGSLVPRQAPMPAGEIIRVTLHAATLATTTAATVQPAPMAQAEPALKIRRSTSTPIQKPMPRPVARSVKPISKTPPPAVAVTPKPAAKATPSASPDVAATPQPATGEGRAAAPAGTTAASGTVRSGEKGGAANAVIPARPRYRENPPPTYPELARRRQMEGTVVVEALVNGRGRVDGLNVHASSGYHLLDDAALKAVRNWLFEPGKKGGVPMAMSVLVPVRFALR